MTQQDVTRWVVVEWSYNNCGGRSLVLHMDKDTVTFATGPTPWGTGSWGPFPRACVKSVRPLVAGDLWPVSGCLSEKWTPVDLVSAFRRARTEMWGARPAGELEVTLQAEIDRVQAEVRS